MKFILTIATFVALAAAAALPEPQATAPPIWANVPREIQERQCLNNGREYSITLGLDNVC